ncbi:MAG: PQQ-binding-like beta-propeller repeat protein [Desulfurococcales archaeon]|nr:PQQ-binding-like beta-propeller repeat protein [Desulfurococcales archaeon]
MDSPSRYKLSAILMLLSLISSISFVVSIPTIAQQQVQLTPVWSKDLGVLVRRIAWSPDGSRIAVGFWQTDTGSGYVYVFNGANGSLIWRSPLLGRIGYLAWSPDSSRIAVAVSYEQQVVVLNASNGSIIWTRDYSQHVLSVAWSPDGSRLAVTGDFGYIDVFDTSNWQLLWRSQNLGDWVRDVVWSPDGERIAASTSSPGKVYVFDFNTGQLVWETEDLNGWVDGIDWNKNGELIVAGVDSTYYGWFDGVYLLNANTGSVIWSTQDLNNPVMDVEFNSQGTMISASTRTGYIYLFDVQDGSIIYMDKIASITYTTSWNPSGKVLAYGGTITNGTQEIGRVFVFGLGPFSIFVVPSTGMIGGLRGSVNLYNPVTGYNATFVLGEEPRYVYVDPGEYLVRVAIQPDIGLNTTYATTIYTENMEIIDLTNLVENQTTLLGQLILEATNVYVAFSLSWDSGQYTVVVDNSSIDVWAAPGSYVADAIPVSLPGTVVGDVVGYYRDHPVSQEVSLSAGQSSLVSVGLSDFLSRLGVLVVNSPVNGSLVVEWPGGSKNFNITEGDSITIYGVPGEYILRVYGPDNILVNTTVVTLQQGSPVILSMPMPSMTTSPMYPSPTTATQETGTSTLGEQSTSTTLLGENTGYTSNISSVLMVVALASVAGVGIVLVARRLRPPSSAPPQVAVDKSDGGSQPVLLPPTLDVNIGAGVAGWAYKEKITGLREGYGCRGKEFYRVRGEVLFAPETGYARTWNCCLLGCGGWGCAYKCSNGNGENVVFKVPSNLRAVIEGGDDVPTVPSKLLEEIISRAKDLQRLNHPGIVRLLAYSTKIPLLVYEYANQGTLAWQLWHGWEPSPRDVVLVGLQIGEALRYIHSRGIVHGDVKPNNVFLSDNTAKLGDFSGIVHLLSTHNPLSRLGYTVGFRAPEQVYKELRERAKQHGVENRIDVYLLGNLLLYLLTGSTIDGENAGDPVAREGLSKVEDADLRGLLESMLREDPLERPGIEIVLDRLAKIYSRLTGSL